MASPVGHLSTIQQLDGLNDDKLIKMGVEDKNGRETLFGIINELKSYKQRTQYKHEFKLFQDPLYGPIELHPLLVKIIDTPQFQRLRDIKQLGGVYYVYPGASHNRFEHSIGVCYLAGVFVESIRDNQPELGIDERDVLCVKIAALCHDMGHGPFSHLFQDLFMPKFEKKEWKHENTSKELLEHLVLVNDLNSDFIKFGLDWARDHQFIFDLITGKGSQKSKEKSFLYQIVTNDTSGVDVDKMDYIARDSQALGFKLGFDWKRHILFSRVIKKNEEYHICVRKKEIKNLHELFHIRNYLFRAAYQHKTKRAVEFMMNDALVKANDHILIPGENNELVKLSDATKNMYAFTKLTDSIFQQIKCSSDSDLEDSRVLLERVDKRQFYTLVDSWLLKPQEDYSVKNLQDIEEAKKEIAEHSCQGTTNLQECKVLQKIKLDWVTFSFGQKEKKENPIENIYYYTKDNPNEARELKDSEMSSMFTQEFEESEYRLYYSGDSGDQELSAIRNGFGVYCSKEIIPAVKLV